MRSPAWLLLLSAWCFSSPVQAAPDYALDGGLPRGVAIDGGLALDGSLALTDAAVGELEGDAGDHDAASDELASALAIDEEAEQPPDEKQRWIDEIAAELPPATPEPAVAPVVVDTPPVAPAAPIAREDRPGVVIGTLLGLLALLALAFLGGHRRVQEFERRVGISQVITAGFPFVLLGLIARNSSSELLSDALLAQMGPLLRVGLGCIGFVAGFRFSAQFRVQPSPPLVRAAAWVTAVPFAVVAVVTGGTLLALSSTLASDALRDPVFVRDALILGTAGAMTARTSTELFRADDVERVLARVLRLEELAGIIGLAVIASYFRTSDAAWQLPGTAWLLLTLGLGTALGLVAYFVLQRPQEGPEFVVLTLGTIGFGAGVAGYLRLSPLVVCFITATCLGLLPSAHKERLRGALRRLERPVYLLSLIVIGALWKVDDLGGWVLVVVFAAARFAGKWLGARGATALSGLPLQREERQVLAVSPMGPLAIAIVVNAQLLYPGGSISRIVAAVLGGAILTEVVVQLVSRRAPPAANSPRESVVLSDPPEPFA